MSTNRRTIPLTVGLSAALVLAGAGGAQARAGSTETASTTKVVTRADIDGDGRADRTTLTTSGTRGDGTAVLRVTTAAGQSMSTSTDIGMVDLDDVYYGAARIDGEAGYEIVLQSDMGAHTGWFRVVTYRDGRLTTLVDPDGSWRWTVDQAVWVGKGYRRGTTASGAVKLTSYVALAERGSTSFELRTKAVQWSNGRWARLGLTRKRVNAATAYRNADWYVPYLRKFYG